MLIAPGVRLGPYEIVSLLGKGGMGEVYKARDSRLGRFVAIKILPAERLQDAHARTRFEREAKAISALSHRNICTLHDVGHQDGIDFLVMELLDGESLAERLSRGALPRDEAIRYAIDIAAALHHAHRNGIVHRDLKPANILLTKSGAKLLDFGLAKWPVRGFDSGVGHDAPTARAEPMTREGAIPGTLEFMAPEVLDGHEADARSDIFAFGNVLYRTLSGRVPFSGSSAAAIVGSIVRDDPPPLGIPDLDALVMACLKKDPEERMQSARDCQIALEWIRSARGPSAPPARGRTSIAWAAVPFALLAGAVAMWMIVKKSNAPASVQKLSIELPVPFDIFGTQFAISPDAQRIIVAMDRGNGRMLHVRSFDSQEFVPIDGTKNATYPFFSPDGRWVGFMADGKMKKVRLAGGPAIVICDAPRPRGATWGLDNSIVFTPMSADSGLFRVSADGGQAKPVTTINRADDENTHRWPRFLPDGRHVIFTIGNWSPDYTRSRVAIVDLDSGKRTTLLKGATDAHYVPGGYLIFGGDHSLDAVRFDPKTATVTGLAVTIINNVWTHVIGTIAADVSSNGTLVYAPYDAVAEARELLSVDRTGFGRSLSDVRRPYYAPRIAPDGRQLLVGSGEEKAQDLWLLNFETKSWSRIATEGKSVCATWSPRGDRIFFSSSRVGSYQIFSMPADESGPPIQLTNRPYWPCALTFTPDGNKLLFNVQDPVTLFDLWTLDVVTHHHTPLMTTRSNEEIAQISPDGHWIAYSSDESGQNEIYVQDYPLRGRKWQVSTSGAKYLRWSADGKEILFVGSEGLMSAAVVTQPAFSISPPALLFHGSFEPEFDVSRDGSHFVMMKGTRRAPHGVLNLVSGFANELSKRMAAQ